MVGHLTRQRISSTPQVPSIASPRGSNSVRGQQSHNWGDSKGEAAKSSTCENEAEGAK